MAPTALELLAAWGADPAVAVAQAAAAQEARAAPIARPKVSPPAPRLVRPEATPARRSAGQAEALFPTQAKALAAWRAAAGPHAPAIPGWRKGIDMLWRLVTGQAERDRDVVRRIAETRFCREREEAGIRAAVQRCGTGSGWYAWHEEAREYRRCSPEETVRLDLALAEKQVEACKFTANEAKCAAEAAWKLHKAGKPGADESWLANLDAVYAREAKALKAAREDVARLQRLVRP